MDARPLGLLAAALLSATMAFILLRWPRHKHRSVSMHADGRGTFLLFAVVSTVSIGMLYVFMKDWFAPALQLPDAFIVFMTVALASQLASAWIPCLPGRQELWHSVAAYLMAILMPVLLVFVVFSPVPPVALKFFTLIAMSWMVVMIVLLPFVKHVRRFYLIYQLIYICLFYGIIFLASLNAS